MLYLIVYLYIYTCILLQEVKNRNTYIFKRKKYTFLFSFSAVVLTPCRLHILTCWCCLKHVLLRSPRSSGPETARPCLYLRNWRGPKSAGWWWLPKIALINPAETFKARLRKPCGGNSFSQAYLYQLKQAQGADVPLAVALKEALGREKWRHHLSCWREFESNQIQRIPHFSNKKCWSVLYFQSALVHIRLDQSAPWLTRAQWGVREAEGNQTHSVFYNKKWQ